ncbi:MAG: GAF domain-containing protein [Granulosicoccus sp.]
MTKERFNLASLLDAQTESGQPHTLFNVVEKSCKEVFGYHFLTILKTLPDTNNVLRTHSSSPGDYLVGALKPMGGTPWGRVVLENGQTWLGNSREDVLWAFPDAQLILSKGCEACACAPVIWNRTTLGVLSLNAERDRYSNEDMVLMSRIAQSLAPALLLPASPNQN